MTTNELSGSCIDSTALHQFVGWHCRVLIRHVQRELHQDLSGLKQYTARAAKISYPGAPELPVNPHRIRGNAPQEHAGDHKRQDPRRHALADAQPKIIIHRHPKGFTKLPKPLKNRTGYECALLTDYLLT